VVARLDYESHAVALDRNELGALLVAAGLGPPLEHALISLLALNGLRVSEATGADIEQLGLERAPDSHDHPQGGKVVTIPLAPRTARAIDLAIGERIDGPVFLTADGRRLDRHSAGRIVRKVAHRAGITKTVTPHTLRHAFITASLDAGVPPRAGLSGWPGPGLWYSSRLRGGSVGCAPLRGPAGQGHFFVSASRRIIWTRVGTPSEVVTAAVLRTNRVSVAWSSMLAARPARLVKMPGA
jgi:Phage integrase family